MKDRRLLSLTESAVMLALSIVLSLIVIYQAPFDGKVTAVSTLPIMLLSARRGWKWGVLTGFLHGCFQMFLGGVFSWGLTPGILLASVFLDYLLAFSVLGFAGIFAKKGKGGVIVGMLLVSVLRFFIHFLSGVVLWTNLEEFTAFGRTFVNHPALYSLVYNGGFMLPETVITVAVGAVIVCSGAWNRLLAK